MANVWKSVCVLRAQAKVLNRNYSTTPPGLLGDVNVLDMSRIVAGPFCTMTLGDLGANVIKVESLDGDESRKWGPPFIKENSDSVYFLSMNRNKKSICVDFKTQEGKNVLYDLAKKCDVMVENFVSGTLDKHGVGYKRLGQLNPRLVYCAITGFGPHGPYAKKPGYDVIAAAMGGFLHSTGEPNGAPVKAGVAITDITTGLHAFGAIVSALYHRERTGLGQKIDCNLFSTQISSMMNLATMYLNCGIEARKYGTAHANLVPYEAFESKDGYMVVGAGSNSQYASLCKKFNREDLITDPRFLDNAKRVENRVELVKIITEIMKTKTNKEWSKIFEGAAFANGPVNKLKEVFEDEHVNAVGLVRELEHPDAGKIKLVGPPTEYSVPQGNTVRMPPPKLGQHTREILQRFLGYSDKKVDSLYQDKEPVERVAVITLRPARKQARKKVVWTEDTVDNEHMNKKKSKCCCIYEKPHKFGESDSEDSDDECEHCFGHVERRKARQAESEQSSTATSTVTQEPSVAITLHSPEPAPPDSQNQPTH